MTRLVQLPCRHVRYTVLGLVRVGSGLTALSALGALALLVLVPAHQGAASGAGRASTVLGVALLAATVSTMVHTVLLAGDTRRRAWDQYLNTLPGHRWPRTLTSLTATCVVGTLAAVPVAFLGLMQGADPDLASWGRLALLVPVAAVPGLLLGLLVVRIGSLRRRRACTAVILLVLTAGALVAVGSRLPDWAELLSTLTPTFAASRALMPIVSHEPLSAPHLAIWVFWCLTPLVVLSTLERHRHRSLP